MRYALYFAPAAQCAWRRFGSSWLGRCAFTGEAHEQPWIAGVDQPTLAASTAVPRRYGFHATLKAPFRLAAQARLDELLLDLDAWCRTLHAFALPPLQVKRLGDFLAAVPAQHDPRIDALAAQCVMRFERYRAPLDDAELAHRRRVPLSAREREYLARWGYPYVFDAFRLHFSLTGSLAGLVERDIKALAQVAQRLLDELNREPLRFDAVSVFEEATLGANFRVVHRTVLGRIGRLVYIVGPSGAGKDSVLAWARERLPAGARVAFATRIITRPATDTGERHASVSEAEFSARLARGEFALHWRAHGCRYGIGREILEQLARGDTVVVNGSREHLAEVRAAFPALEPVHVAASVEAVRARLAARGRESPPAARRRMERNAALSACALDAALEIVNDGPVEQAGRALLEFLLRAD